jgi:hypothetical protein
MICKIPLLAAIALLTASWAVAQDASAGTGEQREDKRVFGIVPNYHTSPVLESWKPLTTQEKFREAAQDAFDQGTFILAGIFGAQSQLIDANRAFGQSVAGLSRYTAAAYGDLAIADYMTEAVFPTILHQDPRYFRRGTGSAGARLRYAMGQIFITHNDSGRVQFNCSEIVGNSVAVAISNAYYVDNRTAGNAVSKFGMQIAVDMTGNVLKEFWPDLQRKFRRKHHEE